MIIKNWNNLGTTPARRRALDIIEAGIVRVLPQRLLEDSLKFDALNHSLTIMGDEYRLSSGRLFIIGGGKAAGAMAEAVEDIIAPSLIEAGLVVTKGGEYHTQRLKTLIAGHPIPDDRGAQAVSEILKLKTDFCIGEDDLVLCLISGGASALMPAPVPCVSLSDKQITTGLLIHSMARIEEINVVRKHLSLVKGGKLGQYFAPATVISLIISDVVGNDTRSIASGMTVADPSTFGDAIAILEKYGIIGHVPASVTRHLEKGLNGVEQETPKELANCRNYIIGDNRMALEAMATSATGMGLEPYIGTSEQTGDTTVVASERAAQFIGGKYAGYDVVLLGGETTLKVSQKAGSGGRNQHYAALSMLAFSDYTTPWLVASIGTDGTDYLPDVAGAIVDQESLISVRRQGLDIKSYLDNFDSNGLMKRIGHSLVFTGETGTNVGDIMLYMR
ncbi:D-glycerate 2-kinase [Dehalogenimonas sp. WBC-2]|nr:D-glycerate 2-kinase [Dehalogenimonas sp. WBC-2]